MPISFIAAQVPTEAVEEPSVWMALLLIVAGLALLSVGGEALVRGASQLALRLRLTPTVIGLTVVAAGTSLPELVVSILAQLEDSADLAVGNVVGSNIFNIALVLGACSLIRVLPIPGSSARLEYPVLLLVTFAMFFVLRGGDGPGGLIERPEAIVMLVALVVFMTVTVRLARKQFTAEERAEIAEAVEDLGGLDDVRDLPLHRPLALVALGGVGLWLGAKWLIGGSIDLALIYGVSERVIGLTIVAGGTGAPELVATLVALRHGKGDMAVGNVIGSNLFNLLAILGIAGTLQPLAVPAAILSWDLYWLLGITIILVPLFFRVNPRIRRLEGVVLLVAYIAYIASLFVRGEG